MLAKLTGFQMSETISTIANSITN